MARPMIRLIDPAQDAHRHQLRRLGVHTAAELQRADDALRRFGPPAPRQRPKITGDSADPSAVLADLLTILHRQGLVNDQTFLDAVTDAAVNVQNPLHNFAVNDSVVTFGTTLTTIVSTTVGPLVASTGYLLICMVHTRLSIDTTGFAFAYARTQAGGSSIAGQSTGTVNGERSCNAIATEIVTGAGSSVVMAARGAMDTATGFSSSAIVSGFALPLRS